MSQQPPFRDHPQFSAADLLVIVETFEVALQTEGFIDTSSSGGASSAEEAGMLAEMRRILHKAETLRMRTAADSRTVYRWYVWLLGHDGYKVASPYEVQAVSATDALAQAEEMRGGVCADFANWEVVRMRTYMDAADETESPGEGTHHG
jgi:hypothetical protein